MALRTQDILVKARELISDEDHWIQGEYGKDAEGLSIVEQNRLKDATCFCAMGAILRATQLIQEDDFITVPSKVWEELNWKGRRVHSEFRRTYSNFRGIDPLITFNDTHSHKEVLELFDAMIAEA